VTTARTCDAVIIGAGVVGTSIAYELSRGGRDVVVVDRGPAAGYGSTSASSAVVRMHYSTFAGVATAWEAAKTWEDWAGYLGAVDPHGMARYYRTGVLMLDAPDFDSARVMHLYEKLGIPYEYLDARQLRERFPALDAGRYYPPKALADPAFWADAPDSLGGFYCPEGGFVDDPALAAQNLLAAAQRHGASARFGQPVVALTRKGGQVTGVELASGDSVTASVVVNAAGPHSRVINRLADVLGDFNIGTRPLRQEVHHLPATPSYSLDEGSPVVNDCDLGTYFRPHLGGSLLVGGTEPACDPLMWLEDPDESVPTPTVPVFEAQVTRLARRVPDATVPARPLGVAGVYDVSDDSFPIYDRTSLGGFYVAIGTSGNQFKNAPVIGQIMRTVIDGVSAGHPHDEDPLVWHAPRIGEDVALGHYSRRREANPDSSYSVLG